MRTIKTLPIYETYISYRGFKMAFGIWFGFFLFCIGGGLMAYKMINKGDLKGALIGVSLAVFYFFYLGYIFKSSKYLPQKTFWLERRDKETMKKYLNYLLCILLAFSVIIITGIIIGKVDFTKAFQIIGELLGGFLLIYYLINSIKVHNDIDYTTNQELSELINLQFDEKIVASYQNFDSSITKIKKNSNIIVITSRKIFFANYNGENWMTINKLISEIIKIGIARNKLNSYLKLVFEDNTSLGLRLDFFEKITTTPQLFIKQFLNILDASIMGYNEVRNQSRRRVSISNDNISIVNKTENQTRNIELNPVIVSDLKTSEEIKSGRKLEF